MKLHEKINEYCRKNGVKKAWIATNLGMLEPYLFLVTSGKKKLPKKYWKKIIHLTGGFIMPSDLIEHYFEDEEIKIERVSDSECKISLS